MQKKIIALAIAGLASSAAFAQSNVTIYGVADATFDNVGTSGAQNNSADYQARNRVTANSSYIGFKGVEDLGNGLKAVFQFENGVNADNGAAGAWNNRDSYVGLAGGFGVVVLGNVTGPTRALGAKIDGYTGATGIGANSALIGKLGGGSGAGHFDQRLNNAIAYISPTFAGFNAVVGYTAGYTTTGLAGRESNGIANTNTGNQGYTFGANYEAGPVYVGYAYTLVKFNTDSVDSSLAFTSDNRLGAYVKIGSIAQIGALVDQTKWNVSGVGGNTMQTTYYVNGKVFVGKGTIIAQYGQANDIQGPSSSPLGSAATSGTGARNFSLGYEHALSKRTILKATYAKIWNEERASYDFLYGASAANTTALGSGVPAGADVQGISLGVRHSF